LKGKRLGSTNPNWKENTLNKDTGRSRAERWFSCPEGLERHHIDGNPLNNSPENIKLITRKEHMLLDGRTQFANFSDWWKSYAKRNCDKLRVQHRETWRRHRKEYSLKEKAYRLKNIERIHAYDRARGKAKTEWHRLLRALVGYLEFSKGSTGLGG
jgi:hypothetical protein